MTRARPVWGARGAVLVAAALVVSTSCRGARWVPHGSVANRSAFEHCNALMVDDIRTRKTTAHVAVRDSLVVVTLRGPRRQSADAAFAGVSVAAWAREARQFVEDTLPSLSTDGVQVESRPLAGRSTVLVLTAARCYAPGSAPDTVWHAIEIRRANGDALVRGGVSRERARAFVQALDSAAALAGRVAADPR